MSTPAPKTPQRILGVLCNVELDNNGFVDVTVTDDAEVWPEGLSEEEIAQKVAQGAIYPPEWIVRGAVSEKEAIRIAKILIGLRRQGYQIIHGDEGKMSKYRPDPNAKIHKTKDYDRFILPDRH